MKIFHKILFVILTISIACSAEPFKEQKKDKIYKIRKNISVIDLDGLMTEDLWKDLDVIDDYIQYEED